jgi:hypothetical protein
MYRAGVGGKTVSVNRRGIGKRNRMRTYGCSKLDSKVPKATEVAPSKGRLGDGS